MTNLESEMQQFKFEMLEMFRDVSKRIDGIEGRASEIVIAASARADAIATDLNQETASAKHYIDSLKREFQKAYNYIDRVRAELRTRNKPTKAIKTKRNSPKKIKAKRKRTKA